MCCMVRKLCAHDDEACDILTCKCYLLYAAFINLSGHKQWTIHILPCLCLKTYSSGKKTNMNSYTEDLIFMYTQGLVLKNISKI